MSSRALRKKQQLEIQKIESSSESESESVGQDDSTDEDQDEQQPAKSNKTPVKSFSMLMLSDEDQDESDSDKSQDEDEEEEVVVEKPKKQQPPQQPPQQTKKQQNSNNKKKQNNKKNNKQQNKKQDKDLDEVVKSIESGSIESMKPLSEKEQRYQEYLKLFKINQSCLNPDNEMKKLFGCKIADIKDNKKKGASSYRTNFKKKNYLLVTPKPNWPDMYNILYMELDKAKSDASNSNNNNSNNTNNNNNNNDICYFNMKWSPNYIEAQEEFYLSLATHDPMSVASLIRYHPYHIDSLLQLSQVCLQTSDFANAGDLAERAVFAFEYNWHHSFNPTQGNCRFEYENDQNKPCFLALFRYIQILGRRGCPRTSLEYCKMLLSLDHSDPLYVRLVIDYYALKSKQYEFLYELFTNIKTITPETESLSLLPNFCYSAALAKFMMETNGGTQDQDMGEGLNSDQLLQQALISFPMVLKPLLEKCKTQLTTAVNNRVVNLEDDKFFTEDILGHRIDHLVSLFVERNYTLWQSDKVADWIKSNVQIVLAKHRNADPAIAQQQAVITKEYETVNHDVFSHLVLSEYSDVVQRLPPDIVEMMRADGYGDNVVPQRDPNQPPARGLGGGVQIYRQIQRQQQLRRQQQQQLQQQLQQQQQFQRGYVPQTNEPIITENPEYHQNPLLGFFHSLMPWNDPTVQAANAREQQRAAGFLDDYVDFEEDEPSDEDN
ncbi:hypothetical protein CYY_002340 [Polysphondylium violaceum]|uniref:Transcription factor 25 n=1 Tax=Polysphondylium violaceum TaxID=133409 RepID=A0A8J4V9P7_9MYCE|nr:hypothetical protein CYY_002340 [Polysphondylium violaceum]